MSPVVVGADLVRIEDVRDALARHGDRYCARVFTEHELAVCRDGAPAVTAERLAARFAAKEAVVKLLRCEGNQPDWRSLEIRRNEGGWCEVELSGTAREQAEAAGLEHISVSLSHEGDYALAVAVAERPEPERKTWT